MNDGTCDVVLSFESVDEFLWCDHSNETTSEVLQTEIWNFSPFLDLAEQDDFTKYIPIQDFIDDNRRVRDRVKY